MAFSAVLADRISFGNCKLKIFNLTNVSDGSGSSLVTGLSNVRAVKAVNNTDPADTFKEAISSTRGQVTFTAVTADDDGQAWVWGN
jgi:hypothetical protein